MSVESHAAKLLKDARRLAGVSQRALAKKAGTVQSVVARIELGVASPSVDTLVRLLAAAGFELVPRLSAKPALHQPDLDESARLLSLPVAARVAEPEQAGPAPKFDLDRAVAALTWHRVKYVLAGVLAARLRGMPRVARRLDLVAAHDVPNLKALAAALRELDPRIHSDAVPGGLAFDCSAQTLGGAEAWDLETHAGRIGVEFGLAGVGAYEALVSHAATMRIGANGVLVASLTDIRRSLAAQDRIEDRQDLFFLEHLISEERNHSDLR